MNTPTPDRPTPDLPRPADRSAGPEQPPDAGRDTAAGTDTVTGGVRPDGDEYQPL